MAGPSLLSAFLRPQLVFVVSLVDFSARKARFYQVLLRHVNPNQQDLHRLHLVGADQVQGSEAVA